MFEWLAKLLEQHGVPCLFKELTGIPCPGCGMTRSVISMLRGDLFSAVHYSPALYICAILVVIDGYLWIKFRKEIPHLELITLVIILGVWIVRLLFTDTSYL